MPDRNTDSPHAEPKNIDTTAASTSVYRAAPGRRTTSAPSTAGISQTPDASGALMTEYNRLFQMAKTTPNTTPMTDATTMSTVRQRCRRSWTVPGSLIGQLLSYERRRGASKTRYSAPPRGTPVGRAAAVEVS